MTRCARRAADARVLELGGPGLDGKALTFATGAHRELFATWLRVLGAPADCACDHESGEGTGAIEFRVGVCDRLGRLQDETLTLDIAARTVRRPASRRISSWSRHLYAPELASRLVHRLSRSTASV